MSLSVNTQVNVELMIAAHLKITFNVYIFSSAATLVNISGP